MNRPQLIYKDLKGYVRVGVSSGVKVWTAVQGGVDVQGAISREEVKCLLKGANVQEHQNPNMFNTETVF